MNTVSTPDAGPTASPLRPVRRPSALVNLVRKECLESREALIVGLVVFWLLPVLLELPLFGLDQKHETLPFASCLLIVAGWLYAIIVGAHTVCRDWGKAEEHFLLAQPVSARAVVSAKLITGAALIAGVMALVLVWETMLAHWGAFGTEYNIGLLMMGFVVGVMAVGYSLAFATAVLTRQMLASTVVAALVLLVWAIAPLLSSHLERFGALAVFENWSRATIGPFVFVSVLGLIVCVATSFFCSTRERVIRLGNKQLAWTIGLVMLTLFGVAMTEVGNSLQVRDHAELLGPPVRGWGYPWMIQRGDRFFAISNGLGTQAQAWRIVMFRVADNGRIQDLRRAAVHVMQPSDDSQKRNRLTGFGFDENGHLVVSGGRYYVVPLDVRSPPQYQRFENLWRITLVWPDGGEPEIVSQAELTLPANKRLRDIVADGYGWYNSPQNDASSYRYAYVVSVTGEGRSERNDKLYVFDWSEGSNPTPRFEIPLEGNPVRVDGGKLHVSCDIGEVIFDVDHPETLLDKQNWSSRAHRSYERFEQFERRPGGGSIQWDRHGNFAYLSDLFGLRIAQQTQAGRWEIIGECRTSPLTMLFRGIPYPKVLDDSLLIEHVSRGIIRGIIAYDVSNPSKPRCVGFLNAAPWETFTTKHNLVLRESNLITAFDRPDQRGKNNP